MNESTKCGEYTCKTDEKCVKDAKCEVDFEKIKAEARDAKGTSCYQKVILGI